ncbi:MAG: ABC transporter permease [Oscillospiraceae bacterium]|jgi:ribose transport system permease protein|nr:ABC transporter permease [Oscillospiraceae bacterium]
MQAIKNFTKSKGAMLAIVTIVLAAFFQIMNSNFLSLDNLKGIMNACSLSGTITVGMACLLMSGSIDLAAGAEGCFGGVMCALLLRTMMPWPVALFITVLIGMVFGLINAFLCNVMGFMPFIATIGMQSVIKALALIITRSQNIAIADKSFWAVGTSTLWIFPMPFVIMAALMIAYGIMIANTRFGRRMLLCGGNRQAARLAGVNPKKVSTIMFVNSGAIASIAGAVLAARMHSASPTSVVGAEMDGMTAAIIGGVSFLGGGSSGMGVVFIGLLLLNTFQNGLTTIKLDAYWQTVASGGLLIIALVIDFYREKRRVMSLKASAGKSAA